MLNLSCLPLSEAPRHEDLFVARYAQLFAWALGLTEGDEAVAEDLVHDAFVQFTVSRPGLEAVENLEGYLRTMLRNLHISQMRRRSLRPEATLCIVECDSAELSLRINGAGEMHEGRIVRDDLRLVCEYACRRSGTENNAILAGGQPQRSMSRPHPRDDSAAYTLRLRRSAAKPTSYCLERHHDYIALSFRFRPAPMLAARGCVLTRQFCQPGKCDGANRDGQPKRQDFR